MKNQESRKKNRILIIYGVMCIIVVSVVTVFSSMFYVSSKNTIIGSVESKLKSNVEGAALILSGSMDIHEELISRYADKAQPIYAESKELYDEYYDEYKKSGKSDEDANELAIERMESEMGSKLDIIKEIYSDPDYLSLINNLKTVVQSTDVTGIYTIVLDETGTEFFFVLDTDPTLDPYGDSFEYPYFSIGDPYLNKDIEEDREGFYFLYQAIENTDEVFVGKLDDEYGNFYTGIKAITDSDGNVLSLICVDIADELIQTNEISFILILVLLLVTIIATFMASGYFIIKLQRRNSQMQQEIERMAYFDSLTSLPNRASLMNMLFSESEIKDEETIKLSAALFIDLDNFKKVNDTRGHLIGDKVLKDIATFLKISIGDKDFLSRPGGGTLDFIARLGGDEFIIILKDSDKKRAATFAENLHKDFISYFKDNQVIEEFNVSLSIGIKVYDRNNFDPTIVLKNADDAMYKAKKSGKGQYYISDDEK